MTETPLPLLRSVADLRQQVAAWRAGGARVALVPTMGALHAGHASLVAKALEHAERVVVSVFVNPTQFGPHEDFEAYPRQEAADVRAAADAGAHAVYAPDTRAMYPDGFATSVTVAGLSDGLCGPWRPGHFEGVATVVAKLLNQAQADVAVFGEKDYQQLAIIRRLARDLDIPTEIIGAPLVRDADGVALSSRNTRLDPAQRAVAQALPRVLTQCVRRIQAGAPVAEVLADGRQALHAAGFDQVDYLDLRDAETLAPMPRLDRPGRLLAVARLGDVRLLDNMPVGLP
ncbi:MAG: pantoate--beta-alanine ligase [Sphingomonadales bacterium]|nr:MAG: pantoate--beta-alanine ligase [Sphingomonadales bacterium]